MKNKRKRKKSIMDDKHEPGASNSDSVLVPLTFPQALGKKTADPENEDDEPVECMLCSEEFQMQCNQTGFLQHLFTIHRLVIGDVQQVASLKSYANFWKVRLRSGPLEEFCTVMLMDVTPDGEYSPDETYYLLSDVLPEDKELREGLQEKRLKAVLERQTFERDDQNFTRDCLFCRKRLEGTRASALSHLSEKHNLSLGRPDNLVFVDELLEKLHSRLEDLRCLFCNNLFTDRHVLREHMRKKQHKCINPNDTEYDKYYVVNYLEIGKTWKEVEQEQDGPVAEEESWSDWCEDDAALKLTCLFCDHQSNNLHSLNCHSQVHHDGFSLDNLNLSFYLQVKLVNYIRRQMHINHCPVCDSNFLSKPLLISHLATEKHYCLPDQKLFDQPEYFFPTYEDDAVLCQLEDAGEDSETSSDVVPE